MANLTSSIFRSDSLQKGQVHELDLYIQQTSGVQTMVPGLQGVAGSLILGDTDSDFTQAAANSLLGVDNDVITATVFGSTAMGTDSLGLIVAMQGQVEKCVYMQYSLWLASEVENLILGTESAPADALTEVAYKTPAGNLAARIIPAGFDAATAVLQVKFGLILK